MSNIRISELTAAQSLKDTDVFAVTVSDNSIPPNLSSAKADVLLVGTKIVADTTFTTHLTTTNKTVCGAINELNGLVLTDTLTAGSTTLTFSNQAITTNSTLDNVWTDVFGVMPVNAVFATGTLTLTFASQANNMGVKVRIT